MMQRLVFILFLGSHCLFGQLPADTVRFDEAIAVVERGDEQAQFQVKLDSGMIMPLIDADLGELLNKRTTSHVLQYGPAGSAGSVRQGGLAADHFTVAWNGLSLNSVTLGQADMSLFPAFLFNESALFQTTNAAYLPGNSFAGGVLLKTAEVQRSIIDGFIGFNQLNNVSGGLGVGLDGKRFRFSTRNIWRMLKNEFSFADPYKLEDRLFEQEHNDTDHLSSLTKLEFDVVDNSTVYLEAWYQEKNTQIPVIMGSYGTSDAHQQDSSLRIVGGWKHRGERVVWNIRGGWTSEHQVYRSNQDDFGNWAIDSRIDVNRSYIDAFGTWYASDFIAIDFGWQSSNNVARNTNYDDGMAEEMRHFAFLGTHGTWRKINYRVSVNLPWVDSKLALPAGGLTIDRRLKLGEKWFAEAMAQGMLKNRQPDFNEKYWVPGGDVNLNPEEGWQTDFSFGLGYETKSGLISASCLLSYSDIDQWIQWVPTDGGYFAPVNYQDVQLFAVTPRLLAEWKMGKHSLRGQWSSTFMNSSFEQTDLSGELPYTPIYSSTILVDWDWRGTGINASIKSVGERFTDQENTPNRVLSPYQMVSVSIYRNQRIFKQHVVLSLHGENLLDQQPEFVRSYATPGRYFGVRLAWKIGLSKSESKQS